MCPAKPSFQTIISCFRKHQQKGSSFQEQSLETLSDLESLTSKLSPALSEDVQEIWIDPSTITLLDNLGYGEKHTVEVLHMRNALFFVVISGMFSCLKIPLVS